MLQPLVRDRNSGYSLASQRWSAQRSCAEAKLEQLLSSGPAGTAGLSAVWTVGVKAAEKEERQRMRIVGKHIFCGGKHVGAGMVLRGFLRGDQVYPVEL